MPKLTLSLSAFFILLFSQAQTPLSLNDAIAKALANNYQIQISKERVVIAENNNTWGGTSLAPSINLNGGFNNGITDNSDNPTSFIQAELRSSSISYGAGLNWTLFDGFGMFIQKEQLDLLEQQSEGNAAIVIENSIQSVALAYYNVLLQEKRMEVFEELIELSNDRLAYERTKQELGASTTFDQLQFENALVADSTNYLLQRLSKQNAMRNLNLLMSESVEIVWQLTTEIEDLEENYDFGDLRNKTLSNNSNIKNQYINTLIANTEIRRAKAGLYPVIGFNAGANQNNASFSAGEFEGEGTTINYFGNFTLNFNLFNGGRARRAIQNAKVNEAIALLNQEELSLNVENDLRNNYEQFVAQQQIYLLAQRGVFFANKSLEIASEKFASGAINSFNFRDIQLAYLQAQSALLESQFNLISTKTNLVRLTGGLVQQ
ncbi:MAG: TolC family protein [Flavobacteriales bacterium]|nr:TolC family protein [Flavobacteriales bacterium]MDG1767039.1 TolC family protein [Flavobacteriales bacterium]